MKPLLLIALLSVFVSACGGPPGLELRGTLKGRRAEAERLVADMLPELRGWRIVVEATPKAFSCSGTNAVGCTSYDLLSKYAYVKIATGPFGTLLRFTSFRHEIRHVWLLETTGDGDYFHTDPVWDEDL